MHYKLERTTPRPAKKAYRKAQLHRKLEFIVHEFNTLSAKYPQNHINQKNE